MSEAIIAIIVTTLLNAGYWIFQRIVNKKTILVERRKTEVSLISDEAATIDRVLDSYNDLTRKYLETSTELTVLKQRLEENTCNLEEMKRDLEKLSLENIQLRTESDEQRRLIEIERKSKEELQRGINILIDQLKSIPVSPKWKPDKLNKV